MLLILGIYYLIVSVILIVLTINNVNFITYGFWVSLCIPFIGLLYLVFMVVKNNNTNFDNIASEPTQTFHKPPKKSPKVNLDKVTFSSREAVLWTFYSNPENILEIAKIGQKSDDTEIKKWSNMIVATARRSMCSNLLSCKNDKNVSSDSVLIKEQYKELLIEAYNTKIFDTGITDMFEVELKMLTN